MAPATRGEALATCDVAPESTATFKVHFLPRSDSQHYFQRLECVASFKSMRSFRLVSEDNFVPPWSLAVGAHGHTFAPGASRFIAQPLLSHPVLSFPVCHVGETGY